MKLLRVKHYSTYLPIYLFLLLGNTDKVNVLLQETLNDVCLPSCTFRGWSVSITIQNNLLCCQLCVQLKKRVIRKMGADAFYR